ncbi:cysteine hydrolase family protein [Peribacillus glennii]|uniref:Cysteine hydrolase n=1 Tax=Peribacillus glennii TaxID=2303991 RepID=A0A372LAV2_9BACI|nr:cysteine hydrolase family protein [Peribacillus glennii]RFU62429.1 cysteine hydrolase [Peribacillus glennii]
MNQSNHDTALLLIDFQKAFYHPDWGNRNNPFAEREAEKLLQKFRHNDWPVIHSQHISDKPGSLFYKCGPSAAFMDRLVPEQDEKIIRKYVNSAFIGTGLEQHLRKCGIKRLVMAGLTTDHCVSTTGRMGSNLGFEIIVAADAAAAFHKEKFDGGGMLTADMIHNVHLSSLHNEFASVKLTNNILRSL